jgi:hypothetical protein
MATTEIEKSRYKKWYEANKDRVKEMKKLSMLKRRQENPDLHRKQSREAKARLKTSLFDLYGHACVRCNFVDKRALTLDHKLNNGNKERKELGERGVYTKAKNNYLPNEYQILCMNCQFIKRCEDKNENQHYVQQLHGSYLNE